ncbi:hypothetical protein [Vulcanococcus limneticus]|uniref:hypothetical protein n=1 Tax=Vulcanococcus limneticus TaxID=2170428 RepID=UPI00398BE1DF
MTAYRYVKSAVSTALEEVPGTIGIAAAGLANAAIGIEAFRSVRFEDLPAEVIRQLRTDGTRGELRSLEEARQIFEQDIPAEAKGSVDGVEAISNDPTIDWMHEQPHAAGGSNDASNGVYGPEGLNQSIGDRAMTSSEIAEARVHTHEVAELATPGVTGDLGEVVGDTLETGAWGGVMGGGMAVAHRIAQAQGYRDAGRHDLAAAAEEQLVEDAAKGAINGVVRGGAVAVTQAVLGANPLTAGIGLVAPDVVMLLSQKARLSEAEYTEKAMGVVGKGALATVLVCAGPIGWLGLAGISIASAYGKATEQATQGRNASA